MSDGFREGMIALIPALRAFAATKVGSRAEVDDLVQETLARALRYKNNFQPDSNLRSWLYKILQNVLYRDWAKRRNTVQDVEGICAARQTVPASQEWRVEYINILSVIDNLAPDSREALLLIGADGYSYKEAADRSHCTIGTLKSRVSRARERLAELTGRDEFKCAPVAAFREQAHQMSHQRSNDPLPDAVLED
jgi:RNA polymerase sigma-70 factor (ECF subfamily)